MNILTAVTKDIKKLKDEYLSALEEIYGENDTAIADISDENTAVAREMIIETGKYDIETITKDYFEDGVKRSGTGRKITIVICIIDEKNACSF